MTASKGVGRGYGGGRPRKDGSKPSPRKPAKRPQPSLVEAAAQGPVNVPPDIDAIVREAIAKDRAQRERIGRAESVLGPASDLLVEAYSALADVMANSPAAAARVSAAKIVIDWARGAEVEDEKRKAELAATTGKKAAAQAAAENRMAGGGKFSAPPPPGATRFQ